MDKKHDKYYAVIMSDGKIMGIPAESLLTIMQSTMKNGARATKRILTL